MKYLLTAALLGGLAWGAAMADPAPLSSLRGASDLTSESPSFPVRKVKVEDDLIDVTFEGQPPVIPHETDKDRISMKENTCLDCHAEENYKEKDSVRTPESHYVNREGKKLETLSVSRYDCTQCHVNQVETAPLVKNDFEPYSAPGPDIDL